jgi:hypothetical protein
MVTSGRRMSAFPLRFKGRFRAGRAFLAAGLALGALPAAAWTPALEQSLYRDAQRLLPPSLARLMNAREALVLDRARQDQGPLAGDLVQGLLQPHTLSAFDAQLRNSVTLMQSRRVGQGLIELGALLRVAADVADPVLSQDGDQLPASVAREYYAFLEAHLDKIPVVLDDPAALRLRKEELPDYWQSLLTRAREDAPVIRAELLQGGRLVRHETLDYRSPIFAVGSLAYSRAVNAIAATWLADWRTVRGDLGGMRDPRIITPRDGTETARGRVLDPPHE